MRVRGHPRGRQHVEGEELFTGEGQCGSCHTLADAGTKGQVGPDLDAAFVQSRRDGLGEETIASVVRNQIAYPVTDPTTGAPGMPANLVTGQDADDVALYVASVAGKAVPPPTGGPPSGGATTGGTTTGGGGGKQSGATIFASAGCGSCHTLAAAGTSGTIGPNLDEAKPPKELVVERVTNGAPPMPSFKGQLSEAEIEAVADYVSTSAGK